MSVLTIEVVKYEIDYIKTLKYLISLVISGTQGKKKKREKINELPDINLNFNIWFQHFISSSFLLIPCFFLSTGKVNHGSMCFVCACSSCCQIF